MYYLEIREFDLKLSGKSGNYHGTLYNIWQFEEQNHNLWKHKSEPKQKKQA